jgi:hypothetical protein
MEIKRRQKHKESFEVGEIKKKFENLYISCNKIRKNTKILLPNLKGFKKKLI